MMKFLLALILLNSSLSAVGWQEHWTKGVENCISKNYPEAEKHFNLAIIQLEKVSNLIHPHVYVDRARLFSLLNRDEEALSDLNIALESPLLDGDDRLRAVVTRLVTYYRLNMEEEAKTELEVFKSIYPIPKLEIYPDTVIIRNIPDCDCPKDLLKSFIANTFCESENDVKINNGICIAKRKADNCECNKSPDSDFSSDKEAKNTVSDCKYWCNKMQVAGNIFCARTFKFFRCQALCIATVELIKDGCYWCCSGGSFYKDCVKPFEDIVSKMGEGCDPSWD